MRAIWNLAAKDIRLLLRDKAGFFFTFGFPIVFAIMFGAMFAGGGGGDDDDSAGTIRIVVVDEDGTDDSRALIAQLESASELTVDHAADRAAAEDFVRRGRRTAFVVVTDGYAKAGEEMFWGDPARLEVGVDPSRTAEAGMLQGILTKYAFQRMQTMFTDTDAMRRRADLALDAVLASDAMDAQTQGPLAAFLRSVRTFADDMPEVEEATPADGEAAEGDADASPMAGWQPVEVTVSKVTGRKRTGGPPNAFAISFPQATIWGVMGCAAAFGISLVVERTQGTLVRLRTAPITLNQILLGKATACFLTTVFVVAVLMAIAVLVFGVRPGWDAVPKLVLATASVAGAFVGIMMLLSVVGRTEAAAGGIGWAVLIVMAMLGGGMIPLFIMPAWMASLASVSPVKWAILAMEGALWRGYSYTEMLLPCGILLAVGALGFFTGSAVFRRTAGD